MILPSSNFMALKAYYVQIAVKKLLTLESSTC